MGQSISRTAYKYEPLEPQDRHIRLLTLHPYESESEPVKCTVAPHSLNWKPSYEALSYCWGDKHDIYHIPIDFHGCAYYASANLYAALQALRYHDKPRVLWIDALCINQSDIAEKNGQIALMGSIYESAANLLVWLGPKSEDSALAMSTIRSFNLVSDFETVTARQWSAMENLFARPWFTRIWVVQEFKRGRNPQFICGDDMFNWDETGSSMQDFWTKDKYVGQKHVKLLGEIGKVVSMASTRLELPVDGNVDSSKAAGYLVRMLRIYGDRKATIPHDKIYGLLGLSNVFSFENSNPPKVDYDRDILQVYIDWARFLISTQNSIDLLYISLRMQNNPLLPTWVPDWRKTNCDLILTLDVMGDCFKYHGPAPPGREALPRFSNDGLHLLIEGFIITTIDTSFFYFDIQPGYIESRLEGSSQKELLRACLMMGCKIKQASGLPPSAFAQMGIRIGRKKFRSTKGSSGIVPSHATYGDVICMLRNSEIPFVLRPNGTSYRLIGDGYIDMGDQQLQSPIAKDFVIE